MPGTEQHSNTNFINIQIQSYTKLTAKPTSAYVQYIEPFERTQKMQVPSSIIMPTSEIKHYVNQ